MRQWLIAGLCFLFSAAPRFAAAEVAAAALFSALPLAEDPHLSPDGRSVAMISARDQKAAVLVWRSDGTERWYFPGGNDQINWVAWKGNDHVLISLRFAQLDLFHHLVGATRLLVTETNSKNPVQVTFREPPPPPNVVTLGRQIFQPPNLQDRVISDLPHDPRNILLAVAASSENPRPSVMMVDLTNGEPTPLLRGGANIVKWMADPDGAVRLRQSLDREGGVNMLTTRVRDRDGADWRVVHRGATDRDGRFIPLAFSSGNPNMLYVMSDQENGRMALRTIDTVTAQIGPILAADSQCDIEPILRNGVVVGTSNPCQGAVESYLDSGWREDQAMVQRALKTDLVAVLDRTADGHFSLIRSAAYSSAPPTFWYFDKSGEQKTLVRIADSYGPLTSEDTAPTRRVTVTARDGLAIPALLTLPRHEAGPLGFVVLPHGGPSAHDSEEFDWIVQFLAHRGYGVIQPQFRGSTGYGAAFQRAGFREWGGKMQNDVTDATRWLVDQHLADPRRICILGFSYGGYAALMGAAQQPNLYKCAGALAAVTDLEKLLSDREHAEFAGIDRDRVVGDSGVMPGQSPVDYAARFPVPVLIVHGKLDFTVPVGHGESMERALKAAGKPVKALYLDKADHFLSRTEDRLACLKAIDTFLADEIGPGRSAPPS